VASAVLAGSPPKFKWNPKIPHVNYHPHPYYNHYPHLYHHPIVVGPRFVPYAVAAPVYVAPDASNPAPTADIRLINPAKNGVTLRFRLDGGAVQTLPAGTSMALTQASVLSFNRGGDAGWGRYELTDGTYRFASANGAWDLIHDEGPSGELVSDGSNPVPAN
jgi:hypothetical protein